MHACAALPGLPHPALTATPSSRNKLLAARPPLWGLPAGSTVPATQLRSLLQDRSQLLVALQQGVPAGRSGHAAKRQRIAPELAGLEGLLGSQDAAPGRPRVAGWGGEGNRGHHRPPGSVASCLPLPGGIIWRSLSNH